MIDLLTSKLPRDTDIRNTNLMAVFGYATLSIGAVMTFIGALTLTHYYQLEQWCALNRVPCPNFASYISFGSVVLVIGILILVTGLFWLLWSKKRTV